MTTYFLSLGSNLGDRLERLQSAVRAMKAHSISVTAVSPVYETPPWGLTEQPAFLNACAQVSWDGTPEALLETLLTIEREQGRTRELHWGPRTLDLDLLYGEGVTRDTEFLRLPHPFFWERAFVLVPLSDIAPDFTFRGQRIGERIKEIGETGVVKVRSEERWGAFGAIFYMRVTDE